MADQNQTTVPAGSPIVINVPPTASASAEKVESKESKREKREAKMAEAKAEGANEVLKSLGVKKRDRARLIEEVKAGRYKLAEQKEETKAAQEQATQAQAQVDALAPFKAQVEALTGKLKSYADAEFNALPEAFQKTIVEMKLDDPAARLDMINVFKRTGVLGAQTAATSATEKPAEQKKAAPSTTMGQAPTNVAQTGQAFNHYETWKAMTDRGEDYIAAQYFNLHMRKILEQRPK